jgi:hypothetical protein
MGVLAVETLMNRLRSAVAQLFALVGLLILGLAIARGVDLAFAYESLMATGDGREFSATLGLLGTLFLPLAGTLLLTALLLSFPTDRRLPTLPSRILSGLASLLAFVVLVVVAARAVAGDEVVVGAGTDLLLALQLDFLFALPVACLVASLAVGSFALWRAGSREY